MLNIWVRANVTSTIIVMLILFLASACASDEQPAPSNPTPELAVVVFATEDPNATPTAAPEAVTPAETATSTSAESAAEPTPTESAATAGVGIAEGTNNIEGQDTTSQPAVTIADLSFSTNRTADINPLTGLKVDDPAVLERRPIMVRIGNDPGARPQVALMEADVVYEEITEWWVTRFTAILLNNDPEMIAPVRSARLVNVPLTQQYQGALANSGGSDGVRWELSQTDIINLDEFFVPKPYFYRENEGWQTRLAFDATAGRDYLASESVDNDVNLRGFYFSEAPDVTDLPAGTLTPANVVGIPYPQSTTDTRWEYDSGTGRYVRFINDVPLVDSNGTQISAANVIIYFAEHQDTDIVEDSNGATSIRIIVDGKGPAWLLRDGGLVKGNWETNGRETPLFFFDNGQLMPLKPGNSWIELVPLSYIIDVDGLEQGLQSAAVPRQTEAAIDESDPVAEPTQTLTPIGAKAEATPESE